MYTCRICLLSKSNVRQITELHEGISYASMLLYVADIKVVERNNQVICHLCSQKLIDSYFFRLMIIRSNQELNVNCKVFKFDSIKDVKAQILKDNYITATNRQETNEMVLVEYQNDYTFHNDTLIQRLESDKEKITTIYKLDTDNENEEDTNVSEANEENYDCENNRERNSEIEQEMNKSSDTKLKKHQLVKNVLIKPKYLEGLKMIPSITKRIKKPTKQPVKREDICPYCGIKTRSMKTHLLIHTVNQKFECNDCSRRFYTKLSLEHHIKSHFNEHIYKCDKCVATFNTKAGIKRHLHIHTDIKEHKCHICNKAFRWKNGLHRHILIHNLNAKTFRCEMCNMSFLNKYTLKIHTRVHTGERPYNCETPNVSEANEENYDCENNKERNIEIEQEMNKSSDTKFKKHQLVKNVLMKPKYLEGLKMIPSITKRIKKPTKQPVKREDICPYCGIKTRSMKTHLLIHTVSQKFECNDCARRFYTKLSLEHHIKSHFNEHIYKCDKCVATFNTKAGLKRHLHIHTDIKEHKCHICNKAFRWKNGLHRHILIHNLNAKPFRCEMCNMSFLNKYTLKIHTRVHTGERPYNCELCSKPYSYKRDFNRHCLNKHGVLLDRRSVYRMNEEILKKEKVLMKDLMLRVHGIPTEREPLDSFKGPQKALAFAKAVKAMQDHKVPIDVQL